MKTGSTSEADAGAQVTVVIPCYRSLATISRAVDSALRQCDGRIRLVLVIDDGSEETRNLIEERKESRILAVTNERNIGAPASRNRGLSLVETPFVAFLDADDHFEGDLLAALISAMQSQNADIGFGPSVLGTAKGYSRHAIPNYRDNEDVFRRWFGNGEHVNTASVAWSTDYLRSIGGWDEAILRNQDGEMALRAILLGARFAQSSSGAGVWDNQERSSRISARSDNLGSLLDVVDKLDAVPSAAVSQSARKEATASHLHNIALRAYRAGRDEVGDEAMRRRRALGYPDSRGSVACRAAVQLRRVPRGPRLLLWRAAASVVRALERISGRSEPLVDRPG